MNRIEEVFGTAPVLLPVIHPISAVTALASVQAACSLGVRGVFFIDQGMGERDVLTLVREVRERHPALWIGVNLLSRTPAAALVAALAGGRTIDGLWSDDAGINPRVTSSYRAEALVTTRQLANWHGLYFGGVAFKYQPEVSMTDLGRVGAAAPPYMDVVCTSGPGTGQPASLEKVRTLRGGMGHHAMALASGVTAENVRDYVPHVQAFLVGTGIEESFGVLDPAKIERLLRAMERAI